MTAPALKLLTRDVPSDTLCLVYARVSTDKQATGDKASLVDQERKSRTLAAALGYPVQHVWSDPGRSGTDPRRLDELVAWCEEHRRGAKRRGLIVTYSPDRFARLGTQLVGFYAERLNRAGWDLRYVDLERTGNALVDGVGGSLRAELAAEESRIKRERALIGMPERAKLGRWQGGRAPVGYTVGAEGKLVPGTASDVAKVRRIFARYADGATLAALATEFSLLPTTVRQMLANPVYTGLLTWGRRQGSQVEPVTVKAHEAVIERRTWDRVQTRLAGAKPHGKPQRPYPFSGMVACSECGRALTGGGGVPKDATPEVRERYALYRCRDCSGSRIKAQELEGQVLKLVTGHVVQAVQSGALAKAFERVLKAEQAAPSAAARLDDLKGQKARLIRLAAQTDDADVATEIKAVQTEITRLERSDAKPSSASLKAEAARAVKAAQDLPALLAQASPAQVQEALRPWLAGIVLDRKAGTLSVTVNLLPHAIDNAGSRADDRVKTLVVRLR